MNNWLYTIEIIAIVLIIIFQIKYFFSTRGRINYLKKIFPDKNSYTIQRYLIPNQILHEDRPIDILNKLSDFTERDRETPTTEIELIAFSPISDDNQVMDEISTSINTYLLRNKGAVTDFTLVKEIVERYAGSEEESVAQGVNLPLFLGLMGTIIGIIFGLLSFYFTTRSNQTDSLTSGAIPSFLIAVATAMVGSLLGLYLTIRNSNFNLKKAEYFLENGKNAFYTFIQIELLPVLNQNISSSVYDLHNNLVEFNQGFKENISDLGKLLKGNAATIESQKSILEKVEELDRIKLSKANITMLAGLNTSMDRLDNFNIYIGTLKDITAGLMDVSSSFKEILNRTDNFKGLAEKLDTRIEDSNAIVKAMNDQLGSIGKYSTVINDVVFRVDETIQKAIDELKKHTETSLQNINEIQSVHEQRIDKTLGDLQEHYSTQISVIKDIMERELQGLQEAMENNKTSLNNLGYLQSLDTKVNEIKLSSASNLDQLRQSVQETTSLLNDIKHKKLISFHLFKKKRKEFNGSMIGGLNGNGKPKGRSEEKPKKNEVITETDEVKDNEA